MDIKEKALMRFLRYVKIDTQSDDESSLTPSTSKQYDLLNLLKDELRELGIKGEIDEYGRLYAFLAGDERLPTIGLNSHVDTAGELSGKNVKPRLIENYDGGTIRLNADYSMDPVSFPALLGHEGDTLVVTDGTTLLGGDDKAGLAIIMTALEYYVEHPEINHHPISVLFTPDEEVGRGPEHFSHEKFKAEWAYTIDGDYPDGIDSENFNAAHAIIEIQGVSIHPGEAKGKLVNALTLAQKIDLALPNGMRPELTEGHEGFFHQTEIKGSSASCISSYLIRNHDRDEFEKMKKALEKVVSDIQKTCPKAVLKLTISDDYRNMKEILDKDPRAIEHAKKVFAKLGIEPKFRPIRGGTDGATFSFLGCPTPNLGTGSYNHHGRYEFLSVRDFEKMIRIVIAMLEGSTNPR